MGAKTWMLVYADSNAREALAARPQLDREKTQIFASALFPGERLKLLGDGDLSYTSPPNKELHIGCFPGVSIVAAKENSESTTRQGLPKALLLLAAAERFRCMQCIAWLTGSRMPGGPTES